MEISYSLNQKKIIHTWSLPTLLPSNVIFITNVLIPSRSFLGIEEKRISSADSTEMEQVEELRLLKSTFDIMKESILLETFISSFKTKF